MRLGLLGKEFFAGSDFPIADFAVARGRGRGQVCGETMENVTAISVNVAYGLAVFLFFGVLVWRRAQRVPWADSPPELPVGKVPVWIYRDADLLGIGGIAGLFYLMAIGNATMGATDEPVKISAGALLFNIGLQFFLAGMATIIVLARIRPARWLGLKWKQWPWILLIAPATVVSMWAVFALLYSTGYMELLESLGLEKVQDTVAVFQQEEDVVILILMAFTAAIVAPVCEEIVFRGYLYPVAKRFTGPWVSGVCTALVFSAAHGNMAALLPLFVFGMVLAALYEFTGSIWAPIAVHFLFNSATVAIQMLVRFGVVPDVPT